MQYRCDNFFFERRISIENVTFLKISSKYLFFFITLLFSSMSYSFSDPHITYWRLFGSTYPLSLYCVTQFGWLCTAFVPYDIVKRYVRYIYLLIAKHRLYGIKLCLSSSFIFLRKSCTIGEMSLLILILYIDAKDLRGYFCGVCLAGARYYILKE